MFGIARVCILYVFFNRVSCGNICKYNQTIDFTTNDSNLTIPRKDSRVRVEDLNLYEDDKGRIKGCLCDDPRVCYRKCCPWGKKCTTFQDGVPVCTSTRDVLHFPLHSGELPESNRLSFRDFYPVISDYNFCKHGAYLLDPDRDVFYVQTDGSLYMPHSQGRKWFHFEDFCLDQFPILNDSFSAVICYENGDEPESVPSEKIKDSRILGMIISTPFLLATFLVYLFVPELQNLHGKSLMCYVSTLCIAYICLVVIQLNTGTMEEALCMGLAIPCYTAFLASFCWMNVMCIDIWWAFSGYRGFSGSKNAERKRFILYNIYSWGVPLIFLFVVLMTRYKGERGAWYNSGIGDEKCFLADKVPTLLYFYGPMALMIIINITLFILTALKIRSIKQDTKMLKKSESQKHNSKENEQRYNLYLKLLLAMGLNWTMEIISWAVEWGFHELPDEIFYLTDLCNALYGVFIFFIFVFKRNVWKLLKKRYYSLRGRPMRGQSLTHSNSHTRSTGVTRSLSQSMQDKQVELSVLTHKG